MDKLMRYTILAVIGGVILVFNMYHADYKLLVCQIGTIVLVTMKTIQVIARAKPEAIFIPSYKSSTLTKPWDKNTWS